MVTASFPWTTFQEYQASHIELCQSLVERAIDFLCEIYFWAFYSVTLKWVTVPALGPCYFNYCKFVVSFWIRKYECPYFILIPVCLGTWDPVQYHTDLERWTSPFWLKTTPKTHARTCVESLHYRGCYWQYNNVKSSYWMNTELLFICLGFVSFPPAVFCTFGVQIFCDISHIDS